MQYINLSIDDINLLQNEFRKYSKEIEELNAIITDKTDELSALKTMLGNIGNTYDDTVLNRNYINYLEEEITKLKTCLEDKDKELKNELKNALTLKNEFNGITEQYNKLENECSSLVKKHKEICECKDKQLIDLKTQLENTKLVNEEVITELKYEFEIFKNSKKSLENENKNLYNSLENLLEVYKNEQNELKNKDNIIKRLNNEIEQKRLAMFEYVEIYEDKLDKLEQLKNEKITINNTHLNYDHSLYFELKTAKKDLLEKLIENNNNLQKQLNKIKDDIKEGLEELKKLIRIIKEKSTSL